MSLVMIDIMDLMVVLNDVCLLLLYLFYIIFIVIC